MLNRIVSKSTDYLVRSHVIDEEDRDVYEYGFHTLYNNIVDISSIVIISIWLNRVPETILYHFAFVVLRSTAGGFHAKTRIQCFVMSTAMWLISLWCISYLASPNILIGLSMLSVLLIWMKAPAEHVNSPLSDSKRKRMKSICRVASVVFFILVLLSSVAMSAMYSWISAALAYGMISHTALLLAALVENRLSTN